MLPDVTEGGVDLSAVLARNARALRGSANLDDVAKAARRYGLNWGTGRVSDLEHGRVSPTLPTLVVVALALADVRGHNVTVADLLESEENILLAAGFEVSSDQLKAILWGDEAAYRRLVLKHIDNVGAAARKSLEQWPAACGKS